MPSYRWGWPPRPSVTALRHVARREAEMLRRAGRVLEPVEITGRVITRTFWGNAWCKNLERYGDFANRLPRGRSYVRNGLVLHLAIEPGAIAALVRGSLLYQTQVTIGPISRRRWKSICADLAGSIDSLVELLQGRLSGAVMDRICREGAGLFPSPAEIDFDCSCPDFASMCKHVAAVLYGIGARLDHRPELLFTLRQVDAGDLIATADTGATLTRRSLRKDRLLASANLSELFGLEIATESGIETEARRQHRQPPARGKKPGRKKAGAKGVRDGRNRTDGAKAKKAVKAKGVRKKPGRSRT